MELRWLLQAATGVNRHSSEIIVGQPRSDDSKGEGKMNRHHHSTYQPDAPVEIGRDRIDLREVQANDLLLFWTQSGCYSFRVTDAANLCGQLSRSGGQACDATWLGAISSADGECRFEQTEIRAGARALFVMSAEGRKQSMVTSAINRLIIIRHISASRMQ